MKLVAGAPGTTSDAASSRSGNAASNDTGKPSRDRAIVISTLPILSERWLYRRIPSFRTAAGLDDVRIHDLRHSFASEAVMGGESLPMVGKILGHTRTQTIARYGHLTDDPLQGASERIAISFKQAMGR